MLTQVRRKHRYLLGPEDHANPCQRGSPIEGVLVDKQRHHRRVEQRMALRAPLDADHAARMTRSDNESVGLAHQSFILCKVHVFNFDATCFERMLVHWAFAVLQHCKSYVDLHVFQQLDVEGRGEEPLAACIHPCSGSVVEGCLGEEDDLGGNQNVRASVDVSL